MRTLPEDDDDRTELARLKVEPWMAEYLTLNPEYVHWGPGEDHMATSGENWGDSQEFEGWATFGPWKLDELNECVHFYFEIDRPRANCDACGRSGYNPATKLLADTFYDQGDFGIDWGRMRMHGSIENARKPRGATGKRWCDAITQDEVDALVAAGRLRTFDSEKREWVSVPRTAAEVNAANAQDARGLDQQHDGINRGILIETRAKRLGVWGMCPSCEGHGYTFTAPVGRLNVVLWMLHPRKGCSRGVRVFNLSETDGAAAKHWLAEAAKRNARRFAKLL